MINTRLPFHAARLSRRDGFTLVELLVVIGIIAILAGVALGPITRGIKQAQESTSMQQCRQIGLMEFAYANDNSQTYPYSANSFGVANLLLNGNYATDPAVFVLASDPQKVTQTIPTPPAAYALVGSMSSFDFVYDSGAGAPPVPSGLTTTVADGTPVCIGGGVNALTLQVSGASTATINTAKTAFTVDGVPVCYKSNSAQFLKASNGGGGYTVPVTTASYSDANAAHYTLTTH